MKIKDLPWFNRPGFKLTRKGVDGLDDAELLAIIFGVGIKGESALELSNRLFRDLNFDGLEKLSVKEIAKECKGDYNKARMIVSFFELIKRYKLNPRNCWNIGDKTADIKMGETVGCKNILVKTGKGGRDGECEINPDYIANDLYDAVNYIIEKDKRIILKEVE